MSVNPNKSSDQSCKVSERLAAIFSPFGGFKPQLMDPLSAALTADAAHCKQINSQSNSLQYSSSHFKHICQNKKLYALLFRCESISRSRHVTQSLTHNVRTLNLFKYFLNSLNLFKLL